MPKIADDAAESTPAVVQDETAPQAVESVPVQQSPEYVQAESLVRGWVFDKLANSPISRDEASWNTLIAALPDLVTAILERK